MDVGFHDGAVHPHLAAFLDFPFRGLRKKDAIDRLLGFGTHPLDVTLEGGARGRLVDEAEAAEGAIRARVFKVKGEHVVAEAVHLLDQESLERLLGAHAALATRFRVFESPDQIGVYQIEDLRMIRQDAGHLGKLPPVIVMNFSLDK